MGTLHYWTGERKETNEGYGEREREVAAALRRAVDEKVGAEATFEEREKALLEISNAASRRCLEDDLEMIAESHGQDVMVDGRLYARHLPGRVLYHSLCGSLAVMRWTYREIGKRNGPTIVPLELEAGLIERATPGLAYSVTLAYAKAPMRSYEEDMLASYRQPPSRSTLERLGKRLGMAVKKQTPRVERYLRRGEHVPQEACAVSLGLDRASVPMEEDRTPGEETTTRRKKRRKPRIRQAPPPVNVRYRMAYVGTIALTDSDGELLTARRYAVAAHEDPKEIVRRLMADLRTFLGEAPHLAVGVVQDGAPEMWNLMCEALANETRVPKWSEAIDRYHLSEHLGKALQLLELPESERQKKLFQWDRDLDHSDSAIQRIEDYLLEAWLTIPPGTSRAEKFKEELVYLGNNKHRMRYVRLRKAGLPVGSGVTEGACKSIIAVRTKRSGQRWRPTGLESVLAVRSIYQSDRLPRFWAHFTRSYRVEVSQVA